MDDGWLLVDISVSASLVLCQKMVECSFWVGGERLPQAREYPGILFSSDGKVEHKHGEERTEPKGKAFSIYQCLYIGVLTYGHVIWVMTESVREQACGHLHGPSHSLSEDKIYVTQI